MNATRKPPAEKNRPTRKQSGEAIKRAEDSAISEGGTEIWESTADIGRHVD